MAGMGFGEITSILERISTSPRLAAIFIIACLRRPDSSLQFCLKGAAAVDTPAKARPFAQRLGIYGETDSLAKVAGFEPSFPVRGTPLASGTAAFRLHAAAGRV